MRSAKPEVVVITGASAGVGRATARLLASKGAPVSQVARRHERHEAVSAEEEALGGQALVLPCDVADVEQVDLTAAKVEEVLGPIDIWINNAMATDYAPLKDVRPDEF